MRRTGTCTSRNRGAGARRATGAHRSTRCGRGRVPEDSGPGRGLAGKNNEGARGPLKSTGIAALEKSMPQLGFSMNFLNSVALTEPLRSVSQRSNSCASLGMYLASVRSIEPFLLVSRLSKPATEESLALLVVVSVVVVDVVDEEFELVGSLADGSAAITPALRTAAPMVSNIARINMCTSGGSTPVIHDR